jgi:hypothetical protein
MHEKWEGVVKEEEYMCERNRSKERRKRRKKNGSCPVTRRLR